ncbi:hypothetical protein ACR78Z_10000 [Sphingobacterium thalpophilum]|uniref:Uncharacterized protein n=1 Tax=Sphingobacterium thalpophilum TaxID=259 RepID=A0A4U9VG15_9SPHI|nr:hypothetical protein [Sphingobacterium thalpophilum]VTR42031.1 Uncharacterised protein [Sphingobacterium thalpophilum]
MRYFAILLLAGLSICSWSSFNAIQQDKNPLYGKIFRDIDEIPSLRHYTEAFGTVLQTGKRANGDYRFAVGYYTSDKNGVCILEELMKDSGNEVRYKILDTINIPKLSANHNFGTCEYHPTGKSAADVIAISVIDENKEYFDNIKQAWRIDTKTQKFIPIRDLSGIRCINEGYGL